ncbi:MAG: DUF3857 and transglutaminase domain-containing protein [Bacteroidales bacterium]|nr:DUF3857 and transglutaminase domain-containing protein [Bacteroidales bacterium]
MRRAFFTLMLIGCAAITSAQHRQVLYDSTFVVMEESGLSHVTNHQRIRANDYSGCRELATLKVDYDPQSAYVEFRSVIVHRKKGGSEALPLKVYDYIAPARLIYWGASQKMVEIGHLDPGDEVEYTTYRKGFTYALLQDGSEDDRYIPPMRGHFYDIVPFWSSVPVDVKYYSVDVLTAKRLRFALYNGGDRTVKTDSVTRGDRTTYNFTARDIIPLKHEPHALADNDMQPKLLLSTAQNWEAKSIWFYGVNEDYGSFIPTPEVEAKVRELLQPAQSEQDSISILTHWVADNIRYAGISMGQGEGYTLHNAEMNFTDRCGVCKDKAGMLVTMLRAAGFKAYAAMTMAHERIDRIPADQFNHSVCAVQHRNGQYEMLDPTWVPNVRELWSSAEQQQGYLMGLPEGADLMYTPLSAPENHYVRIRANTSIAKDGTLSGTITVTAEGQSDRAVRSVFSCRTAEWQRNLEMELLRIDQRAEIKEITHTDNDRYLEQPVSITYSFSIPQYATVDNNTLMFTPLSARNFYSRAMSHLSFDTRPERRTQPFSDACSRMVDIEEQITLPDYYKKFQAPDLEGVKDDAASFTYNYLWGGHFCRSPRCGTFINEKNKFIFRETVRLCKRVYDAADWPAFRQAVENQKRLAVTPVVLYK